MKIKNNIIENPSFGVDVEFFLRRRTDGEVISAEGFVKGSKHEPFRFDEKNQFYATSLDNVLIEGNIPPAKNPYEFYRNVKNLIKYIKSTLPEDLEIVSQASAKLDHKWLQSDNAQLAGCEMSNNCWTGEPIESTINPDGYRGASFHIHIGYDKPSIERNYNVAKAMDLFVGIPSVILEPENDRKAAGYGFAGNMRHKPYGLEYRTPSSYFSSNRKLIQWTFKNSKSAIDFVNAGRIVEIEHMGDLIQDIINTDNKEMAGRLIEKYDIKLV